MADHVLRGPDGAPGGSRPVAGAEASQDRDEPSPLLAEYVEQVLGIELASAVGSQDHSHALFPSGWTAGRSSAWRHGLRAFPGVAEHQQADTLVVKAGGTRSSASCTERRHLGTPHPCLSQVRLSGFAVTCACRMESAPD